MYIDDRGIVLHCLKYDDKSFIAHLFTFSRGHVSFIINASRGKRSGTSARLFQPFSFLAFQWDAKPSATLHRMKEVHLLFVQHEIPLHPIKRSIVMLLSEFLAHALANEAENGDLYEYIEHSIKWFDTVPDGFANFHLVFLLKLVHFLGIAPNMEEYDEGNLFDLVHGRFTSSGTSSSLIMGQYDAEILYRLSNTNYTAMDTIRMNRNDRARILQYITTYYTLHIPKFPSIQSLEVLQALFDD